MLLFLLLFVKDESLCGTGVGPDAQLDVHLAIISQRLGVVWAVVLDQNARPPQ
jgi:hypothetical protein